MSSVVVTDRASLAQNFSENAKSVLCQAAFGAGAYAIGGRLLGFAALTPPSALLTGAALLGAMALCPSRPDGEAIFGSPPDFSGGQCPVEYEVSVRLVWLGATTGTQYAGSAARGIRGVGPFSGLTIVEGPGRQAVARLVFADRVHDFGGQDYPASEDLIGTGVVYEVIRRVDGLLDNCGNAPSSGGQIINNVEEGDTIDNSRVENNSNFSTVIPVLFNLGGINNSINLKFGDIEIEKLLPFEFNIDIGGSRYKFREKPDGDLEPVGINPEQEAANDRIEKLLKGIQECVCSEKPEMSELFLPVVASATSCDIVSRSFLVPKDSVSESIVDEFISSAVLASSQCESQVVEQLPETQIFAATVTTGGAELFTGEIKPEVHSLRLEILSYDPELLPKISLYPDSNQRKFGSVNYCSFDGAGGGDYIYVFDNSTYIPLPSRGKSGRLRVLMKPGTSFRVFDTGERV